MHILLLNTYAHGGAGVACKRLLDGLQGVQGLQAQLLTASDVGSRWPFYAERLAFLPHERDRSVRFAFSPANFGKNLTRHPLVRQADVLHLHWVNQGLLSLRGISQLGALGKRMVWTLHDTWAFTGGCHIFTYCDRFRQSCGHCPYLRQPASNDLSHQVLEKKRRFFPQNIQFVTCSAWLRDVALSSSLLAGRQVEVIPNPIDTSVFHPASEPDRASWRREMGIAPEAKILLFVAMNLRDAHKGFRFLPEALHHLKAQQPDLRLEVIVLGKSEPERLAELPYPVHALGLVHGAERLARIYGAADVFVTPSLADNLPNTVMESLACGTPVAAFRTGGIPEMVEHLREGFIARQGDSRELAEGIGWILSGIVPQEVLRENARQKVLREYANEVVAERYAALYRRL